MNVFCVRIFGKFLNGLAMLSFGLAALILGACMPEGQQNVNTELFKDKEDLKVKTSQLKPGLGKKAAFEAIGVKAEKFQRLSTQEVQSCLYGNSIVQGTPEQLEQFRQKMMRYEGYTLPYRMIKSDSSLGFGKMKIHKTGQDLRLVVIFDDGKLIRATVEGTEEVSQEEDQYMWGSLLKKGVGFVF